MITHIDFVRAWLTSRAHSERGANLVEYALLMALVVLACIAGVTALGGATGSKFSSAASRL